MILFSLIYFQCELVLLKTFLQSAFRKVFKRHFIWKEHCDLTKFDIIYEHHFVTPFWYGLLSNHLFQRKREHGGWKEPQGNNNFLYKKTPSMRTREMVFGTGYYVWRFLSCFFSGRRAGYIYLYIFAGKYLCQSLFCNFIEKGTLTHVFSCQFWEISKNTFSGGTPPVVTSDCF